MGMPNTSNVKSGDFPAIKADWYPMTFLEFSDEQDKNNEDFTKIELGFIDSERKAWINLSHSEDFLWKVKQFKEAIGMGDSETDLTPYKGAKLMVFAKNRVYEGTNYADPKKFKSMNEKTAPAPAKPDDNLPF